MTVPYEAFWVPGLDSELDTDESLELGLEWLERATYPLGPVIVLYAAQMIQNRRSLGLAATRFPVISARTRARYGDQHAVLAVWPPIKTLEFAERLAWGGGLCVIPARLVEVKPWLVRTGAVNLADPDGALPTLPPLAPQIKKLIDRALDFDGDNRFVSAGGKEDAIRALRTIAARNDRPKPEHLDAYVRTTGKTDVEGASRLRNWYERVLEGRMVRDGRGRPI